MTEHLVKPARALISVSDKTGIVEFAQSLNNAGVEILSTGGTASLLAKEGIPVIEVSSYTGFPEMMDGRVKTLHPKVHGGILGRRGTDDAIMQEHGIDQIDMVVVNLYPFQQAVADPTCDLPTAIENIDIGGPTMVRSATKAFEHTAQYDGAIANHLGRIQEDGSKSDFARTFNVQFKHQQTMRYGENPHQKAAFYVEENAPVGIASAVQVQGKELSYNNIADTDAALECVKQFDGAPACVIVKHANPCGVAVAPTLLEAYQQAFSTDPESAFGGI